MNDQEAKVPTKEEVSAHIARTLRHAGHDAFILAAVFALWGIANLLSGSVPMILLGGFQLFLSYLNFNTGMARRDLASVFDTKE